MRYANVITQEIRDELPNVLTLPGQTITGATIQHWAQLGWREVVQVDYPSEGYRVGTYLAVELGPLTCKMTVATQISLADDAALAAAQAAAQLVSNKETGKTMIDSGTYDLALVLRAFAALTLQEINTLRTKAGLATYTAQQFTTALKAKIDAL